MVADQLLFRMQVLHPEGFERGYFGKQNVAFWNDVASPTKIKGNCCFVQC